MVEINTANTTSQWQEKEENRITNGALTNGKFRTARGKVRREKTMYWRNADISAEIACLLAKRFVMRVRELLDCCSDKYYKARQYWSPLAWSHIVGSDKTLVTFMSFVHKCLNPSEVELWTLPGLNKAFSVVEVNKKKILIEVIYTWTIQQTLVWWQASVFDQAVY